MSFQCFDAIFGVFVVIRLDLPISDESVFVLLVLV